MGAALFGVVLLHDAAAAVRALELVPLHPDALVPGAGQAAADKDLGDLPGEALEQKQLIGDGVLAPLAAVDGHRQLGHAAGGHLGRALVAGPLHLEDGAGVVPVGQQGERIGLVEDLLLPVQFAVVGEVGFVRHKVYLRWMMQFAGDEAPAVVGDTARCLEGRWGRPSPRRGGCRAATGGDTSKGWWVGFDSVKTEYPRFP